MFLPFIYVVSTVMLLAGGASLARLGWADVGVIGEVRFFLLIVVAALAAAYAAASVMPLALSRRVWIWITAFILLHAFVCFSWMWSARTEQSSVEAYELALLTASVVVCALVFGRDARRAVDVVVLSIYAFATLIVVAALIIGGRVTGELAAIGAGGIGTARLMGLGVTVAFYLALRRGEAMWLLPIPLMFAAILLSGSRAAVLSLVFALAFLFWRRRLFVRPRPSGVIGRRRFLARIAVLSGLGILLVSPYGRDITLDFVMSNITVTTDADSVRGSLYLADRDVIFADAWDRSFRHPLTGIGIGTYLGPFGELYPHNVFLSYAIDAGWGSLFLFVALLIAAGSQIFRSQDPAVQVIAAMSIFYVTTSLFAGSYYDARLIWVFLLIGLLVNDRRACGAHLHDAAGTLRFAAPLRR